MPRVAPVMNSVRVGELAHSVHDFLDQPQERVDRLFQVILGRVLFLAMRQSVRRVGEHHHDRHVRHHLRGIMEGPGWKVRRVAGHLTHRFLAHSNQPGIKRPRFNLPDPLPLDADLVLRRDPPGRRSRLGKHLRQHRRIERPLIQRDLTHARHRRDDARLHLDRADRAHDAGLRRGVFSRDVAERQRAFGRGQERVLAHRYRRRPGMRGLSDETKQMTLHTKRADHDSGRLARGFEHWTLFDMQLEIGLGVDRLQELLRLVHPR